MADDIPNPVLDAGSAADPGAKPPVLPGEILAGKYRIERVVGAGAMGVVVAATHLELDERVALKFLKPAVAASAEAVARFLREARATAKIKSEHAARIADVGRLPSGEPYLVMEFLVGTDLERTLKAEQRLSIERATEYVLQACEALAEAHALGIVHRDLKPANLFLSRRADGSDCVKVLDFGLSKAAFGEVGMTATAAQMGTPLYMSPEQWESARNVDARSDVWSLGAILYELITGKPPFEADSITQLAMLLMSRRPQPLSARAPVPSELDAAVLRCLERDPARRFQSVGELAEAIAPFAPEHARTSARRISKVLAGVQTAPIAAPGPADPPRLGSSISATVAASPRAVEAAAAKRGSAGTFAFGAAAVLVVGGIAVAAWMGGRSSSPRAEAPIAASPAIATTPPSASPPSPPPSAVAAPAAASAEAKPSGSDEGHDAGAAPKPHATVAPPRPPPPPPLAAPAPATGLFKDRN